MMVQWYVFALIAAITATVVALARKKALATEHAMEYISLRAIAAFAMCFIFIRQVDFSITTPTLGLIFIVAVFSAIGMLYLSRAYRHLEISTVAPMMNLSPLLLVIITAIVLGEKLSFVQLSGIILLVAGAYVLEADGNYKGVLSPIKNMVKEKYQAHILVAIIVFSFSALFDKIVLGRTDPVTFLFFVWMFLAIILTVVHFVTYDGIRGLKKGVMMNATWILISAAFAISSTLFYYKAVSLAFVSLVIPIKRMSSLFTTVIGGEIFHDHSILRKTIACLIMIAGASLIIL